MDQAPLQIYAKLRGTPVLVTGAGGFIGLHLLAALVASQARPIALMRNPHSLGWKRFQETHAEAASTTELVIGDVRDADLVQELVGRSRIVLHLAGMSAVADAERDPQACYATNFQGTLNVLDACRDHAADRLVNVSSGHVYGRARSMLIDEQHPLLGDSVYATSKIAAEVAVEAYVRRGLSAVTLRPSNIFGLGQGPAAVTAALVQQLQSSQAVSLQTLTPVRDFLYVSDMVECILLAAINPDVGGRFNVSSGQGCSIRALADAAVAAYTALHEVSTPISVVGRTTSASGEKLDELVLCSKAAAQALGWSPKVSLQEGFARMMSSTELRAI